MGQSCHGYRFVTGDLEDIQFNLVRCSRKRVRVVLDYLGQSFYDYRFVTGGLEDFQFSEVFKNQG